MRRFAALLLVSCTQSGPITGNGETVYTGATKTIQFENQGGGFAPPPPSGPCNPQKSSFTLTVDTEHLAWALCDVVDTQPPTTAPRDGDRTLTAAEWDALQPVLDALVVDTKQMCGADKPMLFLTITTDAWTQKYGDSFYNCPGVTSPSIATEALDTLQTTFNGLAN